VISFTPRSLYIRGDISPLPFGQESRDSSVGIELGYGLDDRGSRVRFLAGLGIFLFTTASRMALRSTQPPIQWVPGALSMGVKWPGGEADHSPPSSAEVKSAWNYTSTPPYVFMSWCSVIEKHSNNFTFYALDRRLGGPQSRSGCGGEEKQSKNNQQ
jgi:hypothetical protein